MTTVTLLSFALFTLATTALPTDSSTGATLQPRQEATGFCEWRSPNILYKSFNIEINNTQDGGLCGGFWDNVNGSGGCGGATGRECVVEGNIKKIFFRAPQSCDPGDIEWIIREVTDPQVDGVVCVRR